jgi:hypothetical protein
MMMLRLLWKRDRNLWFVLRSIRGKRIYAIWSTKDPLPALVYLLARFIPGLVATSARFAWSAIKTKMTAKEAPQEEGTVHETNLEL